MWFDLQAEASFVVDQIGVSLSRLEANHLGLCIHQKITQEGIDRADYMTFPGCCLPGETQPQTDTHLQGELRDRFNRCLELEVLMREEFHLPLLASGRVLLNTDHLANIA